MNYYEELLKYDSAQVHKWARMMIDSYPNRIVASGEIRLLKNIIVATFGEILGFGAQIGLATLEIEVNNWFFLADREEKEMLWKLFEANYIKAGGDFSSLVQGHSDRKKKLQQQLEELEGEKSENEDDDYEFTIGV